MDWPDILVRTCLSHLEWRHRPADEADLSMDGLVPEETQERWRHKVAGAKFTMPEKLAAAQERVAAAHLEVARQRQAAGLPATPPRPETPRAQ